MIEGARLLFAHGAGAGSSHPWMKAWAARLGAIAPVTTFDHPYLREKRRPDRHDVLVATHRAALAALRAASPPGTRLILAGKSMGSRIGCHVAVLEPESVAGLVCLGYPLIAAHDPTKVRDAVLLELRAPILFVQGTRDELAPLDRLAAVRARMTAPSELFTVDGGDHSLLVRKKDLAARAQTQADVDTAILAAVRAFVAAHASNSTRP